MDNSINPNQMPPMSSVSMDANKKGHGPLVAVVIILILIIVGGLYLLKNSIPTDEIQTTKENDTVVESLNTQSGNDDLNSIEMDLNSSDFENLDQGAAVIEAEIQ